MQNSNLKNLIWIASYPKSGNTWIRSILSALLYTQDGLFDFGLLPKIDQFEKLENFKFIQNINNSDFKKLNKMNIVSKYWKEAQERIISEKAVFFKTHSSNYNYNKLNYANLNKTRGCIYIIRDPRDVVISYSKFIGHSIDETINYMLGSNRQIWNQNKTIGIILSRWDFHVASWLNLDAPKMFIKYEDLLNNTKIILTELTNFMQTTLKIQININKTKIDNVIKTTSFDILKKKEEKDGFNEASKKSRFFRSGKSQQWKNTLNLDQVKLLEKEFSQYMKKFNYL